MTDLVPPISDERLQRMIHDAIDEGESDNLVSALTELQSLRAQGGVRVKPLEWSLNTVTTQAAESLVGWYHVERRWDLISDPVWYWYRSGERPLLCSSEVEAKASAQADYERRILSSLEASPAPVSGVMAKPTVEQAIESLVSALDEMRSQQAKRDEFLATLIVNIEKNEPTAEFAVNLREYVRNGRAALAAKGGQ